mmetsp:Transcript_15392/g.49189  ORF Transcript_15392/g.49189 Transcript_15392/m.49189 type:complete len:232 (+) Transcript_15392:20-715(+)
MASSEMMGCFPLFLLCLPAASALSPCPVRVRSHSSAAACAPLSSRREALVGAALAALAGCASPASAAPKDGRASINLQEELYALLRVQESTMQESRLVKTGKYRDLQRLNIKRATRMMLENSDFATRFNKASAFAPRDQVMQATTYGNTAVEGLNQILEYFPQDLKANSLTPEQTRFVLAALASVSTAIDKFLAIMPAEPLAKARAQMAEENELNLKEFDGVQYLNPPEVL